MNAADFISENCSTIGTGNLLLNGSPASFAEFRRAWQVSTPVYYSILDGVNRESGIGQFNGLSTIERTTIIATLENGVYNDTDPTPINLQGASVVSCTFNAEVFNFMLGQTALIEDHVTNMNNPHETTAQLVPYISASDPVSDATELQTGMYDHATSIEERVASRSGILTGGFLSGSGTTFSVSTGRGKIFDSYTNPENTSIVDVSWPDYIGLTIDTGTDNIVNTYILMSSQGNVVQVLVDVSGAYFRDYIVLGVIKSIGGVISEVINTPSVVKQTSTDLYDYMIQNFSMSGNRISPVDAQLSVWCGEGQAFYPGVNFYNDIKNPNLKTMAQVGDSTTPITITMLFQDGSLGANITSMPKFANPSGNTLDPLSGNNATIHRLYVHGCDDNRDFVMLYGQTEYPSCEVAKENLAVDDSTTFFPDETRSMTFVAYICIDGTATDFTDINAAWIVNNVAGTSSTGGGGGGSDPDAVTWAKEWVSGQTYIKNNWVTDAGWGAVCTADSTESRPAPIPEGNAEWLVPDQPTWLPKSYVGAVYYGIEISNVSDLFAAVSVRMWIPDTSADITYRLYTLDKISGLITAGPVFKGSDFSNPGWYSAHLTPLYLAPGSDVVTYQRALKSNTTTDNTYPWTYKGVNDVLVPANGEAYVNTTFSQLRISTTEQGGVTGGRYAELDAAIPGTIIVYQDATDVDKWDKYEVLAKTDNSSWFKYDVTRIDEGINGSPTVDAVMDTLFQIPVPLETSYVELTDYFLDNPYINGVLGLGISPPVTSQNAFGIDVKIQAYIVSPDWDIVSYSDTAAAAAGGTVINNTLSGDGIIDEALSANMGYQLDQTKVPIAGDVTVVGNLGMAASLPTDPSHLTRKDYVDAMVDNGILPAIDAELTTATIVDVFIYDTSQDDDGGAWVGQANWQSWFSEAESATRGPKSDFPRIALIVAEATKITIYDGTQATTPMWMVIDNLNSTIADGGAIFAAGSYPIHAVTMKNGELVFDNAGAVRMNFITETSYGHANFGSNTRQSDKGIALRQTQFWTYSADVQPISALVTHDITMTSDGQMGNIIAVGTDEGVSRIAAGGTVSNWNHTIADHIVLNLAYMNGFLHWSSNTNTTQVLSTFTNALNPLNDSDINNEPLFNTSHNAVWSVSVLPINNTVTTFPSIKAISKDALGTSVGLTLLGIDYNAVGYSMFANITAAWNSGWCVGDVRRALLSDTTGSVSELAKDRCYKKADLTVTGVLSADPVASGAEMQAVSGFGTTNYLQQAYSDQLDFGTSDFYVALWVSGPVAIPSIEQLFTRRDLSELGGYYEAAITSTGQLRWDSGGQVINSSARFLNAGWKHVVLARGAIWVNGRLDTTGSQTGDVSNATAVLRVGLSTSITNPFNGSLSLMRFGAGTPTQEQIEYMYDTEKALFESNAKCILQGASNNINTLDHDDKTGILTVGAADHTTRFNGLDVVGDDTDSPTSVSTVCNKYLLGS